MKGEEPGGDVEMEMGMPPVMEPVGPMYSGTEVKADPQRPGDPARGYSALINRGHVGCGVPYSAFQLVGGGAAPENMRLPGREGRNAELSYEITAFTTKRGVEVVAANCLACHAAKIDDRVIIGLGDSTKDFTQDGSAGAELPGLVLNDPAERAEWRLWADRVKATAPYMKTLVVGVNPADNLAAALFAHRDPITLEWSDEPLIEPPPTYVVPTDVPPWWGLRKKNAMFYDAAGQGDHARIMMTASVLCIDNVEDAREIDSYFTDIRAYIESIEPPPYPYEVDMARAERGRPVFEETCSRCHGTYGPEGVYPNRIIALEEVGTDPALAANAAQRSTRFKDWFEASYFGELASLVPSLGYMAPPLDGVWATAPYLHNASVPTIAALLDSTKRPRFWKRSAGMYDQTNVGVVFEISEKSQADETNVALRRHIYDTTLTGYSNAGHPFGDALTAEERTDVIEYLKTL